MHIHTAFLRVHSHTYTLSWIYEIDVILHEAIIFE